MLLSIFPPYMGSKEAKKVCEEFLDNEVPFSRPEMYSGRLEACSCSVYLLVPRKNIVFYVVRTLSKCNCEEHCVIKFSSCFSIVRAILRLAEQNLKKGRIFLHFYGFLVVSRMRCVLVFLLYISSYCHVASEYTAKKLHAPYNGAGVKIIPPLIFC